MSATLTLDLPEGLAHGAFPERRDRDEPLHDRLARAVLWRTRRLLRPALPRLRAAAAAAQGQAAALQSLSDHELRLRMAAAAPAAVRAGRADRLPAVLALAAEGARRSLSMQPYPTQLMGAAALLEGRLAEMQTGEGKTLTAGLAATVAGAAGLPTHVVTVNEYLAERDATLMAPLLRFFGLSAGLVTASMPAARKAEGYARPVTWCTNQTIVFDYLRDRVASGGRASLAQEQARQLLGRTPQPLLLRGLHFAIVDEADSILVDEARTPLILSELSGMRPEAEVYAQALALAGTLQAGRHFDIDAARRDLQLNPEGLAAVRGRSDALPGVWKAARGREQLAAQALRALHLYQRDRDYVVIDGQVQIVDEYTGRVLEGRSWEGGLHQMIEAKESLALTEPARTLARITFQRFFGRYLRLAGMTGTAAEVGAELHAVYRLDVVRIPTHRPEQRRALPPMLLATQALKWQRAAFAVAAQRQAERPVLVGTRSVQASEQMSARLHAESLPHQVLNARQDREEAQIVAGAGRAGQVTVATNMAGRGTDIRLDEGVVRHGGLVVLQTEVHDSARIDRQLVGRCARQGDPGLALLFCALDDEIFGAHCPLLQRMLQALYSGRDELPTAWLVLLRWRAQHHAGRLHARARRRTLRSDRQLDALLGFAGNQI